MNRRLTLLTTAIILAVVLVFGSLALAQSGTNSQPGGEPASSSQPEAASPGSDSNPSGPPEVVIPKIYQPAANQASLAGAALATVYFTPQDENTSTTVLFLYSTNPTTTTVGLETFTLSGDSYLDVILAVPPNGLVRISGDPVSTVADSWLNTATVDFTTNSAYAKLSLPAGVKADGYVVWNDGLTYDPLQVAPTLPLRFSSDPASVFLPLVQR